MFYEPSVSFFAVYPQYNTSAAFLTEFNKSSAWVLHKLGYPVVSVELTKDQLMFLFHEAWQEYSQYISEFLIQENYDNVLIKNIFQTEGEIFEKFPKPNSSLIIELSDRYGMYDMNTEYVIIPLTASQSVYDLKNYITASGKIHVQQVLVNRPRVGLGSTLYGNAFVFNNYSPFTVGYGAGWNIGQVLTPLSYLATTMQATDLAYNMYRKLHFFEIVSGSMIRISPVPDSNDSRLTIRYKLEREEGDLIEMYNSIFYTKTGLLDLEKLNENSLIVLRHIFLMKVIDTLIFIRKKYDNYALPNAELTLNVDNLKELRESTKEKIDKYKEWLDNMKLHARLQRKGEEAEALERELQRYPMGFLFM